MSLKVLKRLVLFVFFVLFLLQSISCQNKSDLESDVVVNTALEKEVVLLDNHEEEKEEEVEILNSDNIENNVSIPEIAEDPFSDLMPAVPLSFTVSSIGINDHPIYEYTNEMVAEEGKVNPDSWNSVAWWSGGGRPGTTLNNTSDIDEKIDFTTYLYGHSTNNDKKKVIFDDLDLLNQNDEIIINTELGLLIYSVDEVFILAKSDLMTDNRATWDVPGRLVLISCWRSWSGSAPTTENVVVIASLIDYVSTKEP